MFPEWTEEPGVTGAGEHLVRVFGHEPVLSALSRSAAGGRGAQSLLLAGPPAIGKRTVARRFAQQLACTAADGARPCGACRACRLVAAGGWPDLQWVEPPLRIEAVRALQHDLALSPVAGGHRVAILPEVELASAGAANSLLKTLEEPPSAVVLVLTTADLGAVLPTVRSRCQVFTLRPLPVDEVAAALEREWAVDASRAALLARLSGGRLGWAVRALSDESVLAERERWLAGLATARGADVGGRLGLAAELAKQADRLPAGLAVWSSWWRDILLAGHGLAEGMVNQDRATELAQAAGRYRPGQVVAALRAIDETLRRLAANGGPQLALESLLLELP